MMRQPLGLATNDSRQYVAVSVAPSPDEPDEPSDSREAPARGDRIAHRYELIELLGSGGFGEVWRARDRVLPGHTAAIKLLHSWRAKNPEALGRFEREVGALAAVKHEHIVALHDWGISDDQHYLVMEFVAGRTLREYLDDCIFLGNPPALAWARDVFAQICNAASAMHTLRDHAAIVHRDLKPDNIMVISRPNERPFVKVLDFGLARLGEREFTRTGTIAGTPEYMAPEQHLGRTNDIAPCTDVFSLAVILIELLTLQRIPEPTSQWWAVAKSGVKAIERALQALPASVPDGVLAVLASALGADPRKRPVDAGVFHDLLERAWAARETPWQFLRAIKRLIFYRLYVRKGFPLDRRTSLHRRLPPQSLPMKCNEQDRTS